MSDRIYNKLYVNKNREEGSEKILLGFQHNEKNIVLATDTETYFHVPQYTTPIALQDSSLIIDGATGGPFPAAADRIFKSRKNFGNITHNGTPGDIADGTWYCSWLYKDPTGFTKWMDRMYNPGSFKTSVAVAQLAQARVYVPNDPIFRDVPSKLVFEPGVLYKYFHVGEKTAADLVSSFGGLSGEFLKLDLKNWGSNNGIINETSSSLQPTIKSNVLSNNLLYPTDKNPERIYAPSISFDNKYTTEITLEFDESYCPTNEFTLAFWANSPDWNKVQTTQLVGNHSSVGGYGVYVQTLSSYPFFVIPETNYGHLLYVNEMGAGFLDKPIQISSQLSVAPRLIAIDFDQNVVVCNRDNVGVIYKLDSAGKIIASTKRTSPPFSFSSFSEIPLDLIIEANDNVVVRTNKALYTFDSNLTLKNSLVQQASLSSVISYRYDISEDFYEMDITDNVYDSKFIETTQWLIPMSDQNLYRKIGNQQKELFYKFEEKATNFAIDPFDRIWVMHGNNNVTVLDSKEELLADPLFSFDIGLNTKHEQKNISFFCSYDKETNSRTWTCVVYYSDEPYIYLLDMQGSLLNTISIFSLFNTVGLNYLNQSSDFFSFLAKGDFTGYEHRRVFKNLSPYNNNAQLVFKAALKDRTKNDLAFDQFRTQTSIAEWDKDSWQHFVCTLKNKTFSVYVGQKKTLELSHPAKYELSYENRPLFFIGTSPGSRVGLNNEIGSTSSIFNGKFQDIKVYNYALDQDKFDLFLKASIKSESMYWTMPIPNIQYIEKIDRVFKNKIPGAKSLFYKIKLKGTAITDPGARLIIEEQIKRLVEQTQPIYTDLLEIVWID